MKTTECKCCGDAAEPFGAVDFNRSAEDRRLGRRVLPVSDEIVAYERCRACGFVFTRHFDGLSDAALGERVYNAGYAAVDPDFAEHRPAHFAAFLTASFAPFANGTSFLDYGGGEGRLAALMRARGFAYDVYDPYFHAGTSAPSRRYDVVSAFEVIEHARSPIETARDALGRCAMPGGLLLFSTLAQPRDVTADWWYIAPRNGHVSIHTVRSLRAVAHRCDATLVSLGKDLHIMARAPSPVLDRLIARHLSAIRYHAARRGPRELLTTVRTLHGFGVPLHRTPIRHVAQAVRARLAPAPGG